MERETASAARGQDLLEAAISVLRKQGYETVQVMDVAGPGEIRSVYLEDARDGGRVALVQVSEARGLMSAEVVRRAASDGSSTDRLADKEAQAKLCRAMEAAEEALSRRWKLSVLDTAQPGTVAPKVKADIPAKSRRIRVEKARNTRSIG